MFSAIFFPFSSLSSNRIVKVHATDRIFDKDKNYYTAFCLFVIVAVISRGGVNTRLETKDSPSEDRPSQGYQGQECSRPRTGMLEAKVKD